MAVRLRGGNHLHNVQPVRGPILLLAATMIMYDHSYGYTSSRDGILLMLCQYIADSYHPRFAKLSSYLNILLMSTQAKVVM